MVQVKFFLLLPRNSIYFSASLRTLCAGIPRNLQNKTIPSLFILAVMVAILITIVPTPGFLGSYNAGVFIALHEIMGESEIKSVSVGMVGWVLFAGVILLSGLYFIFHDHMSLKTLVDVRKGSKDNFDQREQ